MTALNGARCWRLLLVCVVTRAVGVQAVVAVCTVRQSRLMNPPFPDHRESVEYLLPNGGGSRGASGLPQRWLFSRSRIPPVAQKQSRWDRDCDGCRCMRGPGRGGVGWCCTTCAGVCKVLNVLACCVFALLCPLVDLSRVAHGSGSCGRDGAKSVSSGSGSSSGSSSSSEDKNPCGEPTQSASCTPELPSSGIPALQSEPWHKPSGRISSSDPSQLSSHWAGPVKGSSRHSGMETLTADALAAVAAAAAGQAQVTGVDDALDVASQALFAPLHEARTLSVHV